ncbi:MAG: hypothetical protein ACP5O2_09845 [Bacteroidales bacterium]
MMQNYKTSLTTSKIFAALPIMQESDGLPTLFECLSHQDYQNLELVACVNQPEAYHKDPGKRNIIEDNIRCLQLLEAYAHSGMKLHILDHSSPGKGWSSPKIGVGMARKVIMDYIASIGSPDDLIVSIDADTHYPPAYFSVIKETLQKYPHATGLCVPYHHPLTHDEETNRCLLRYEIYMRAYALNLLLIGNPYAFSALGSAMATTVKNYRRLNGITPVAAGEDFYFVQKWVKNGPVITWATTKAYPSGRFSNRVFFGTGPAMIKGRGGDWSSYPIYHPDLFVPIRQTFESFELLFEKDIPTPLDDFFVKTFGTRYIWEPLRSNARSVETFTRACMQKLDGLRILQYLKAAQVERKIPDESGLNFLLSQLEGGENYILKETFATASIQTLDGIRMFMEDTEYRLRQAAPVVNQKYFSR